MSQSSATVKKPLNVNWTVPSASTPHANSVASKVLPWRVAEEVSRDQSPLTTEEPLLKFEIPPVDGYRMKVMPPPVVE